MKKYGIFIISITILIVFSISYYIYRRINTEKENAVQIRTVQVIKEDLNVIINATGEVKASTQLDITSEIAGKITSLLFDEGDRVSKGDILAIIDDTQQKEGYIQTEADYQNTLAQMAKAENSLKLQEVLNDKNVKIKGEQLEQARLVYNQAVTEVEEAKTLAKAEIERAETTLEITKKQLDKALAGSRNQEIDEQFEKVKNAEITMKNAEKEFNRQKELYEKSYVPQRDVDDAEKNFLLAKGDYEVAKSQYDLLSEGTRTEEIAIYEAQVEEAQKNLNLQITQADQNVKAKERALELAMNSFSQAKLELEKEIDNYIEVTMKENEITSLKASLNKVEASKNQALDELSKTKIISPINGIIISRPAETGDVVMSQTKSVGGGSVLMTIADLEDIYAESNIDEVDIGKLKKGIPVIIKSATYQGLKIPGEIGFISAQAEQVEQIPAFKVKIKILLDKISKKELPEGKTRYELLFPGMSVDADIYVKEKKDVLQLPVEAVWEKDGKSYVTLVKDAGIFEDGEVITGIKNITDIEIVKGLKEGDTVKIPDTKKTDTEEKTKTTSGPPPRF